jgi:hypothetical protein
MAKWIVLLAERPSGLRPWKVLSENRADPGSDLPLGLITEVEASFGPFNHGVVDDAARVQEQVIEWEPGADR